MQLKKELVVIVLFVLLAAGMAAWPSNASGMDCTVKAFNDLQLKDEKFGKSVTIESAAIVPAAAGVPEHCDVVGIMWPTIRFEVMLPTTTWNERLLMAGNGGKAGTIPKGSATSSLVPSGSMTAALKMGYAATGTDTGHCSAYKSASQPGGCPSTDTLFPGATFGNVDYPTPGANPEWRQKIEDHAFRSVHETIVAAKKMVQAYYNKAPLYTYWVGCSTGGRQGLMEAQRYPTDFNGIADGAAVNNYVKQAMAVPEQLQPQYSLGCDITTFCGGPQIPPANLAYLGTVVYNKCDGMDGLVDGIIDDPRKCHLDVDKDLAKCPLDNYSPYTSQPTDCFTSAQLGALKQIYAGGFTSTGELVVEGTQTSAEAFSGGWNNWLVATSIQATSRYRVGGDTFNFLLFDPPQPDFDALADWNWDTSPALAAEGGKLFNATNPDLWAFYNNGGKIIMYHGWADVSANPLVNTLPYYESVLATMPQAREFLAYYLVPGMGHCSGGVGCGNVDWFSPLVNWVEKGQAPGPLKGSSTLTSGPYKERTRPICRYPEVARWDGVGDQNDWLSFSCVPPIQVRIEPETLNLKSKGEFTAFITLPEGYDVRDWNIHDVSCEGAAAVKSMVAGNAFIAKFKREDLKNVFPGEAVLLTVKLSFFQAGKKALTQGSDTVRVIK
ncbi:MAG: tannase/feruloyl esterase family alpha/beta hydrolase [candidate division WOR-3 bacterium]